MLVLGPGKKTRHSGSSRQAGRMLLFLCKIKISYGGGRNKLLSLGGRIRERTGELVTKQI